MNHWMSILLSLSLSGVVLTLVLLTLTRLLGRRLGRRWQYYVWGIVVLRLLLPIPGPGVLPAMPLPQAGAFGAQPETAEKSMSAGIPDYTNPSVPVGIPDHIGQSMPTPPSPVPQSAAWPLAGGVPDSGFIPAGTAAALSALLAGIWLAVAAVMFGKKLWNYRRALKLLRRNGNKTEAFREALSDACRDCGMKRLPQIWISPCVSSPAAVGLFQPMIAVPLDFSADQAYYVFLHEATHIRRRDALYKWTVEIAVCVHWFNPVVRLLRKEIARACELSCDEAVIRRLDGERKRIYGNVLLDTLRSHIAPSGSEMALPLSENAKWMKERLGEIMGFKRRSRGSAFAAAAVSAVLAGAALLCGFAPPQNGGKAVAAVNVSDKEPEQRQKKKAAKNAAVQPEAEDGERTIIDDSDVKRRADQTSLQEKLIWKNEYIVALAWNVDPAQYGVKREIAGKTVCYGKKTVQYADDQAVTEAVRQAIEQENGKPNGILPQELVLLLADGPFEGTADELALQFYREHNLLYFTAVIDEAGDETWTSILEQSYENGEMEYFAMVNDKKDSKIEVKKRELARRAARDGKTEFFAILSSELTEEELGACALEAYEGENMEIFYMAATGLNSQQADLIAEQAYEEDRTEYIIRSDPADERGAAQRAAGAGEKGRER
uniref:M56 family metallopeptidase n=1 Tax=Enterocloster asparagiformis TaxID=333367 RepID=UPI0036F25C93